MFWLSGVMSHYPGIQNTKHHDNSHVKNAWSFVPLWPISTYMMWCSVAWTFTVWATVEPDNEVLKILKNDVSLGMWHHKVCEITSHLSEKPTASMPLSYPEAGGRSSVTMLVTLHQTTWIMLQETVTHMVTVMTTLNLIWCSHVNKVLINCLTPNHTSVN